MKNFLTLIFVGITVIGCSHSDYTEQGVSSEWVTENHIPYPNKPYQRKRAEIVMDEINLDNDFVVIESTTQYVIWRDDPQKVSVKVFTEIGDSTQRIESDEVQRSLPTGDACLPIINNAGTLIGEVNICDGEFCDSRLTERYQCNEVGCKIKQDLDKLCAESEDAHPYCNSENTDKTCPSFGELTLCSGATTVCGQSLDK